MYHFDNNKYYFLFLLIFLVFGTHACASGNGQTVLIRTDDTALEHAPVYADFPAGTLPSGEAVCVQSDQELLAAQIEELENREQRLWWLASLPAGSEKTVTVLSGDDCPDFTVFQWNPNSEQSDRLLLDSQPILQYEHPVYDPGDIEMTKKPFHHVFDPETGEKITKGTGGLYPHHRGIFFGYNQVYVDGGDQRIDIWHAREGERSEHEELLSTYTGPVMGGHKVRILWKDLDGEAFAEELRDIRTYRQPNGEVLIDFHTELRALADHVRLDGDRQHGGVQFRASQYVADNPEHTRYIRPDDFDHLEPDEEVGDNDNKDYGWNALVFRIEDRPYTISYFSNPDNPGPAAMSERLYGRFGEFFPYELTPDNPLNARYRFWITAGETATKEHIQNRYETYIHQPDVVPQ